MTIVGVAKIDCKTKNLIHRLSSKDIAIIDHEDLDYVCAYALAAKRLKSYKQILFISGNIPIEEQISF